MEKWRLQHHIFAVESFIKNNLVISVQHSFRQRFGINGVGTEKLKVLIVKFEDLSSVLTKMFSCIELLLSFTICQLSMGHHVRINTYNSKHFLLLKQKTFTICS